MKLPRFSRLRTLLTKIHKLCYFKAADQCYKTLAMCVIFFLMKKQTCIEDDNLGQGREHGSDRRCPSGPTFNSEEGKSMIQHARQKTEQWLNIMTWD